MKSKTLNTIAACACGVIAGLMFGLIVDALINSASATTEDYLKCVSWVRSDFGHLPDNEQDTLIIMYCDRYL